MNWTEGCVRNWNGAHDFEPLVVTWKTFYKGNQEIIAVCRKGGVFR